MLNPLRYDSLKNMASLWKSVEVLCHAGIALVDLDVTYCMLCICIILSSAWCPCFLVMAGILPQLRELTPRVSRPFLNGWLSITGVSAASVVLDRS